MIKYGLYCLTLGTLLLVLELILICMVGLVILRHLPKFLTPGYPTYYFSLIAEARREYIAEFTKELHDIFYD